MDRSKVRIMIPLLIGALALILAAAVLSGQKAPSPAGQTGPVPTLQEQPVTTGPAQPTQPVPTRDSAEETTQPGTPEATAPAVTLPEPTLPEQTEPVTTEPARTEPVQTEPVRTEPPVQIREIFPAELEGGMLTVRSLFQFTGMNPDGDNAFGENIAGVEMTNTSDQHMLCAEVAVLLEDGTELTFRAEDVPPGGTVMAFSLENGTVADIDSCAEVDGYADFDSADPLRTDLVQCTADGIAITVRNVSGTDLTDLKVACHGLLDGSYFGGTTYQYTISALPAGASTVIYAMDCILGMAEVVRVDLGG